MKIISTIIEIQTLSSDADCESFVKLNHRRMQLLGIGDFKMYKEYLQQSSVIECDNHYTVGKDSMKYRLGSAYRGLVEKVVVDIPDGRKAKSSGKMIFFNEKDGYRYLSRWFNNNLQIDLDAAVKDLDRKYQTGKLTQKNPVKSYNRALISANNISHGKFAFKVDDTVGRVHTSLTSCSKHLRPYLTYNGDYFVGIDIKNAQPFFSTLLFDPDFYSYTSCKEFSFYSLIESKCCYSSIVNRVPLTLNYSDNSNYSRRDNILIYLYYNIINKGKFNIKNNNTIMIHEPLQVFDYDDIKLYVDLVKKGQFYEYFQDILNKYRASVSGKNTQLNRVTVKKTTFFVFHSSNFKYGQKSAWAKRVFNQHFPHVYQLFKEFKKNDNKRLAIVLQAIETELVLKKAAKRISRERRRLPIFTIHDSIVTTEGNEEYVKSVLKDEIRKAVGVAPPLSIEYWKPLNKLDEKQRNSAA